MREQMQTIEGKENGNCLAACISSILEIDIETIPNVSNTPQWLNEINSFLNEQGFHLITIHSDKPEDYLKGHHLIIGYNKRLGCNHAQVGFNGAFLFDPSINKPELTDIHYGILLKVL